MNWSYSITRRLFLFLAGGVFAKLGVSNTTAIEADRQAFSAAEILAHMAETYAKCTTYQDSGCVSTVFVRADSEHTDKKPFSTAFIRPALFRFDFKSTHDGSNWHRYIVWADGADVRTWWSIQSEVEQRPSLSLALAGATGVSGGSAHTTPALLMPDSIGGRRLTELTDLKRLEDAQSGEFDCFRIQGKSVINIQSAELERRRREVMKLTGKDLGISETGPETLWIDKSTFLLRRIDEQTQFSSFRTESTTIYEPSIDVPIADKQLLFDPPGK
jgi:outer membrane lipoprotein-sorting protein